MDQPTSMDSAAKRQGENAQCFEETAERSERHSEQGSESHLIPRHKLDEHV